MSEHSITKDEVLRIANLARLTLSDSEAESMTHDLASILKHIKRLDELNTKEIAPATHAISLPTHLGRDVAHQGLSLEQSMKNAPERLGDGFGVPKIIE